LPQSGQLVGSVCDGVGTGVVVGGMADVVRGSDSVEEGEKVSESDGAMLSVGVATKDCESVSATVIVTDKLAVADALGDVDSDGVYDELREWLAETDCEKECVGDDEIDGENDGVG